MTDYTELVKALRCGTNKADKNHNCEKCRYFSCNNCLYTIIMDDAADAIEALQAEVRFWEAAVKGQEDGIKVLQAEVKRLKEGNEELREKQTYADHNGDKWRTGGKDILQAAYDHGYMDGWDKAKMEVQE